ncbi:hypothetical protein D9M69_492360 [compost metagenome]
MTTPDDEAPNEDRHEVTAGEIAAVLEVHPSTISRHKDDLPPPSAPTATDQPGRPASRYSIEALADFAYRKTAHLNEAQCRLLVAFQLCSQRKPAKTPKSITLVPTDHGTAYMVPSDLPFTTKD